MRETLLKAGYSEDAADARIAHDILLKAIHDAGFHDNITVKGGVVMSGLTDVVRRATMDMDVDFLHYSLANDSVRRFVSRLNRAAPCKIGIIGRIVSLKQQDYWPLIQRRPRMLNAGVDVNGFAPVGFDELVENYRVFNAAHADAARANPFDLYCAER